jgi:hypothetical protein
MYAWKQHKETPCSYLYLNLAKTPGLSWKKIFCEITNLKEAEVDTFTSDKTNFRSETFFRDKVVI